MKKRTKKIKAWAVFNKSGEFCEAHPFMYEVAARCSVDDINENWGEKGAWYEPCELILKDKR